METYSNQQLRELEKELESYKLDTPCVSSGLTEKYCGVLGEKSWYTKNGALKDTEEWIIKDPIQYQQLNSKLTQLRKLQIKTAYAKKMERQEIAKDIQEINSLLKGNSGIDSF